MKSHLKRTVGELSVGVGSRAGADPCRAGLRAAAAAGTFGSVSGGERDAVVQCAG